MSNKVTAAELSKILGIYTSTMYYLMHPEKKWEVYEKKAARENKKLKEENAKSYDENKKNIKYNKVNVNKSEIDIDEFIENHKMDKNIKFRNELRNESFLTRMEKIRTINVEDYPEWITTKELKELTGLTITKIVSIRKNGLIKYLKYTNENFSSNAKGKEQYLYNKESVINYLKTRNIHIEPKVEKYYEYTNQFFSPKQIRSYLLEKYNFDVSQPTIYRAINEKGIPALKVGNMLKIPIIEFTEDINLKEIFNIPN